MDYTNYQNPSMALPRDFLNNAAESGFSVRTVEPNRSDTESTEQRLYGAYRNTDQIVRDLTPDSTPDAPLIYPFNDAYNTDIAQELNDDMTPAPMSPMNNATVPMPNFTTATRTRNNPQPELYTPIGDKTAPMSPTKTNPVSQPYSYTSRSNATKISLQNDHDSKSRFGMLYNSDAPYPDLTAGYYMDNDRNMYLPERKTPYYNMSSAGYEDMNDFEQAEKDMEYLRQLYPAVWRMLQNEIDEECDKLEYEGSCMFDEYPDRVTLDRIIHRIYDRIKDSDELKRYGTPSDNTQVSANQLFYSPCPGCNWAEDFVRIMFLNEIHNRRRRYRNRRRWFY